DRAHDLDALVGRRTAVESDLDVRRSRHDRTERGLGHRAGLVGDVPHGCGHRLVGRYSVPDVPDDPGEVGAEGALVGLLDVDDVEVLRGFRAVERLLDTVRGDEKQHRELLSPPAPSAEGPPGSAGSAGSAGPAGPADHPVHVRCRPSFPSLSEIERARRVSIGGFSPLRRAVHNGTNRGEWTLFRPVGRRPRVAWRSPDSGGGPSLAMRNLRSAPPGTCRRCPLDGTWGFVRPVCSGRGRPPLPPAGGLRAWSAWKVWPGRLRPRGTRHRRDSIAERSTPAWRLGSS